MAVWTMGIDMTPDNARKIAADNHHRTPLAVTDALRTMAARVEAALGVSCRAPEQPGLDPLIALLEQDLDATRAGADGPG